MKVVLLISTMAILSFSAFAEGDISCKDWRVDQWTKAPVCKEWSDGAAAAIFKEKYPRLNGKELKKLIWASAKSKPGLAGKVQNSNFLSLDFSTKLK